MSDGFSVNSGVTNPQTKAQIEAAVRQRIANADIKSYADLDRLAASSIQIFGSEVKDDVQKESAYLEYSRQLLEKYYDINGDGTVTVDEFAKKEEDGAYKAGVLTAQQVGYQAGEAEKTIAKRTGNLFAQNLDFNANGNIDASELAFFNKEADRIDGKADGKITNVAESAMCANVTGEIADNPEFSRVVNKYLTGQTLTSEEQQTLKDCQATIRKNIGKAAGLNIEG